MLHHQANPKPILNSCRDSYVEITKMDICVAWFLQLHLCYVGCACFLSLCRLGCQFVFKGYGGFMNCVPLVDNLMNKHMFLSWFLINMFILHNEKSKVKGYVPSHACFYFHNEPWVLMVWLMAKHGTRLSPSFDHCVGLVWLIFCSHIMIRI